MLRRHYSHTLRVFYRSALVILILTSLCMAQDGANKRGFSPGNSFSIGDIETTAEEGVGFARKMFQCAPGEGTYTITSTTVPNSFLRGSQWQHIAGEGNAMFLRTMPSGPVKVFNFNPNPNFKF